VKLAPLMKMKRDKLSKVISTWSFEEHLYEEPVFIISDASYFVLFSQVLILQGRGTFKIRGGGSIPLPI
jgi:hypothetical protein